jgi:hypothetical protein
LLVGLHEQFEKQVAFIPLMRPYPSFTDVRSILQLEAQNQARKVTRPPQVFTATRAQAPPPPLSTPPVAPSAPTGWRPRPNYKGKNPVYWPLHLHHRLDLQL